MKRRIRNDVLAKATRSQHCGLEPLESRRLLTVTWNQPIGHLELQGTNYSDYFGLTMISATEFEIRTSSAIAVGAGARYPIDPAVGLTSVTAWLYGSNDTLLVQDMAGAPAFTAPMLVFGDDLAAIASGSTDVITTGGGNDLVYGHGMGDVIKTGNGDDTVYGFDTVGSYSSTTPYQDADSIDTGSGNDVVYGGPDKDTISGGNNDDELYGNEAEDNINGGADADAIYGGDGGDTLQGGTGGDDIEGGNGSDSVLGQDGTDILTGGAARDTIKGGNHDDRIDGGNDRDSLLGEGGNDVVAGGLGNDTIEGGTGNDEIEGGDDTDSIAGGAGNDVIDGGNHADFIWGGLFSTDEVGNDVIEGGEGNDQINAAGGNDTVNAGAGDDVIDGGSGDDRLHGEEGNDVIDGGTDADSLFAGSGNDELNGGDDDDLLVCIDDDAYDDVYGDGGFDSFWIDKVPTSTWPFTTTDSTDADSEEKETNVHKVEDFDNGADLSLDGDEIDDPEVEASESGAFANYADHRLFSSAGPVVTDVKQGELADCWLMATLASVANKNQNAIRQLVADLGDGTFVVEIGNKQYRVDADLYHEPDDASDLVYANFAADDSLWVALVEKAWALYRDGTYESLNNDTAYFALDHVGGASALLWNIWPSASWALNGVDYPDVAAVAFTEYDDADTDILTDSHAHAIIDVDVAGDAVLLYNPYGKDGTSRDDGANDGFITVTVDEFKNDIIDIGGMQSADFSAFNS
jgi:Ca2+-binding RTX toxin-like protein